MYDRSTHDSQSGELSVILYNFYARVNCGDTNKVAMRYNFLLLYPRIGY